MGVSEVRFKKLYSFTLEISKNHLIRNFLRNGRLRVKILKFNEFIRFLSENTENVVCWFKSYLGFLLISRILMWLKYALDLKSLCFFKIVVRWKRLWNVISRRWFLKENRESNIVSHRANYAQYLHFGLHLKELKIWYPNHIIWSS